MTNDERYSPQWVIDGAKEVMGAIDLDPASCRVANERVGAAQYYDMEMDGLAQPWHGRVFLNPPYSNCRAWIDRLAAEIEHRRVMQAVLLCPIHSLSQIESRHHSLLRGFLFVPTKRITYLNPHTGQMVGTKFGSLLLYVGPHQLRFTQVFAEHGTILRPVAKFGLRLTGSSRDFPNHSPGKQETGEHA